MPKLIFRISLLICFVVIGLWLGEIIGNPWAVAFALGCLYGAFGRWVMERL